MLVFELANNIRKSCRPCASRIESNPMCKGSKRLAILATGAPTLTPETQNRGQENRALGVWLTPGLTPDLSSNPGLPRTVLELGPREGGSLSQHGRCSGCELYGGAEQVQFILLKRVVSDTALLGPQLLFLLLPHLLHELRQLLLLRTKIGIRLTIQSSQLFASRAPALQCKLLNSSFWSLCLKPPGSPLC